MDPDQSVRLGVLGTARAAQKGIIEPARRLEGVRVEAIASRSLERARAFAGAHSVPRAFGSYEALLEDPAIDAVYVALPIGLHATWAIRALERGKHVLCEKPLALNASLAGAMVNAARKHARVLQEALHLLYLPTLRRQREIAASGSLGRIRRVVSTFRHPKIPMAPDDFRLDFELGGGSALDLGSYAVACMICVAREEPDVLSSEAEWIRPNVDRWMRSALAFPSGATGVVECGFAGAYTPSFGVVVECEKGSLSWGRRGVICTSEGKQTCEDTPPVVTYDAQLQAFLHQVHGRPSDAVSADQAIATARVLDAMCAHAGLKARVPPDVP